MAASVHARAVRRAAELLGGRDNLARALHVSLAEIEKWLSGERKPPRELFLRVVDIIIDDSGTAPGEPGAEPPAPRESAPASAAFFD